MKGTGRYAQALQILGQPFDIPITVFSGAKARRGFFNKLIGHAQKGLAHVLAFQHLAPLLVDQFALLVHHIVIAQHVLSDLIVAAFNALLRVFDLFGQHAGFQRHIFFHTQLGDQRLNTLTAKQAHEVILK